MTARLSPSRRNEDNEQQHTRQEEQGVIENEKIQRATPREHTDNYSSLSNGDSDVANQGSEENFSSFGDDAMIINED